MRDFLITIIIPVYNEEKILDQNIKRTINVLESIGRHYEIILIDDGSRDNSWEEICVLLSQYGCISAIKLSRNFGKEAAICAGMDRAKGDCCILMDADMQHPPEYIPQMINLWREEGYDIVEAIKSKRGKEPVANKFGAWLFYKMLNTFCGLELQNASDFRLLDRKVIDVWKAMPERDTFFRAMSTWVGFDRIKLEIEIGERTDGNSKWTIKQLIRLAIHAITSFSAIPLYFVTVLGFIFLGISFVLGIQTVIKKFVGLSNEGFTTVILLLLIIGSILMISLGIIGIYIAKIYDEVKKRPRYLVSKEIQSKNVYVR